MKLFYVFNEQGVRVLETSDEEYASAYADSIGGWYCCDFVILWLGGIKNATYYRRKYN